MPQPQFRLASTTRYLGNSLLSHLGVYSPTCEIRVAGILVDQGLGNET